MRFCGAAQPFNWENRHLGGGHAGRVPLPDMHTICKLTRFSDARAFKDNVCN